MAWRRGGAASRTAWQVPNIHAGTGATLNAMESAANVSALGPVAVRTLAACWRGVGRTQASGRPCQVQPASSKPFRPASAR